MCKVIKMIILMLTLAIGCLVLLIILNIGSSINNIEIETNTIKGVDLDGILDEIKDILGDEKQTKEEIKRAMDSMDNEKYEKLYNAIIKLRNIQQEFYHSLKPIKENVESFRDKLVNLKHKINERIGSMQKQILEKFRKL